MIKGKLVLGILLVGLISFWGVSPVYSNQRVSIDDARDEDTLHYDGPNLTDLGADSGYFIAAVRFANPPPGTLIAVLFFHADHDTHNLNAVVFNQGDTIIEPYIADSFGWHRIDISMPYAYSVNLWIGIEVFSSECSLGVDSGPMVPDGGWIYYLGHWATLEDYGLDYNWNIRAIVHREGGGIEEKILNQQQRVGLGIHPNPCRVTTKINLGTTQDTEDIKLRIYDAKGCLVKTFYNVTELPFNYVMWHGEDNYDRKLPCGVYFVLLQTPQYMETKEVILLK